MKMGKQKQFGRGTVSWTPEEQTILKNIIEIDGVTNWNQVSRKLGEQSGKRVRPGKQCRQRYMNHLKFQKSRAELLTWDSQQENKLFELYEKLGSQWVIIKSHFQTKSQNCLKNKFYGALRKFVRRLNQFVKQNQKIKKMLKYESVLKPLEFFDEDSANIICGQVPLSQLRKQILKAVSQGLEKCSQEEIFRIIYCMNRFNLITRRQNRKKKLEHAKLKNKNGKAKRQDTQIQEYLQINKKQDSICFQNVIIKNKISQAEDTNFNYNNQNRNILIKSFNSENVKKKEQAEGAVKLIDFTLYELQLDSFAVLGDQIYGVQLL